MAALRRIAVTIAAAAALVVTLVPAASAHPAADPHSTTKGAPPLPAIGEYDRVAAPMPTGAIARKAEAATAANLKTYAGVRARWRAATQGRALSRTAIAAAAPTARTLRVPYTTQVTSYWCGPATLDNVLRYLGMSWSGTTYRRQHEAAHRLGTGTDGTDWYGSDNVPSYPGSSWYPVHDALNYSLYYFHKSFRYAVHGLPGSPTTAQKSAYKANLVADIGTKSMPFPINEYAAPGYQIGKQPSGMWIMHWIAANGYSSSGSTTVFSDPGWGAGSASTASSNKVVVAAGGRGYIS